MPSQGEWVMHALGEMRAEVRIGFREVHRRLDIQDRDAAEWRRYMLRRMDLPRPKNGNGHAKLILRFLQANLMIMFIVAGVLGYKQPEAFRDALIALAAKVTLGLIGG